MNVTITIGQDAFAALRALRLEAPLRARAIQAMAKRGEVFLKKYFKGRQAEPNKRGWAHSGFWYGTDGVAQHTQVTRADANGAAITIDSEGFARKVAPKNPMLPKRGKFLAIPKTEAAAIAARRGRLRDVFPNAKPGELRKLFSFVRSVSHDPDPRALPSEAEWNTELKTAAEGWAARHFGGNIT